MELDIQRFLMSPQQLQFEFQHFPSSYLRRAAHRVAHHYGLQTLVLDSDGADNRAKIIAIKSVEGPGLPPIPLSEITTKQSESPTVVDTSKIMIRARPAGPTVRGGTATKPRQQDSMSKSVEEREEEYGRARARIFKESETLAEEGERSGGRVAAIFRDREKDRTDPDYDRSYQRFKSYPYLRGLHAYLKFIIFLGFRYVRGALTSQSFGHGVYQGNHGHCDSGFPQPRHVQGSGRYQSSGHVLGSQFYDSGDGSYAPFSPSPTMVYAQSYDYFRDNVFQVISLSLSLSLYIYIYIYM